MAWYERLARWSGGETHRFGSVVATWSAFPIPNHRRVLVLGPTDPRDLADALGWMQDHGEPFRVLATEDALPAIAETGGGRDLLPTGDVEPGMTLHPLPDPPGSTDDVGVELVRDEAGLRAFSGILDEVFHLGLGGRLLVAPEALRDPEVALVLARRQDEPAGAGLLLRTGDVAGVYAIAVRPDHRRVGLGTALTWAVLREGQALGCHLGALQASEMGYGVYERMGFRTSVRYHRLEVGGGPRRPTRGR